VLIISKGYSYNYDEYHKLINEILYKKCVSHNKYFPEEDAWLPCTKKYFYRNNTNSIDGLFPECKRCSSKRAFKWNKNNKERFDNSRTKFFKSPKFREWSKKNYEEFKEYQAEWKRTNKDKIKEYGIRYSNKKHDISKEEWQRCKTYFNNCCAYCGISNKDAKSKYKQYLHKEHVIHDGSNKLDNCVPACKGCNSSKHQFSLEEWYNKDNINFTEERFSKIVGWITEYWLKHSD
jgi:hypothetical protein